MACATPDQVSMFTAAYSWISWLDGAPEQVNARRRHRVAKIPEVGALEAVDRGFGFPE
jgi:hypothetical protein